MPKINRPDWNIPQTGNVPLKKDPQGSVLTIGEYAAYLFQSGVPEWSAKQEYVKDSFVRSYNKLYVSLANGNIGHQVDDRLWWALYPPASGSSTPSNPAGGPAFATQQETDAGTVADKIVSPATLAKLDIGHSFGSEGYFKLPGGFIFQWGLGAPGNAFFNENDFPLPWPNVCFRMAGAFHEDVGAAGSGMFFILKIISTTKYGVYTEGLTSGHIAWIAVGH